MGLFVVPQVSKAFWTTTLVLMLLVLEGSARQTWRKKDLMHL